MEPHLMYISFVLRKVLTLSREKKLKKKKRSHWNDFSESVQEPTSREEGVHGAHSVILMPLVP